MEIFMPIAVLAVIAIISAVLLTLASTFFSVKENEKFAPIRDCLPGANCGACGYSGCDAYAKALAEGRSEATALCVPGGADAARSIAEILGVKAGAVSERVAYVYCNGNCGTVERKNCRYANGRITRRRYMPLCRKWQRMSVYKSRHRMSILCKRAYNQRD